MDVEFMMIDTIEASLLIESALMLIRRIGSASEVDVVQDFRRGRTCSR